MAVTTDPVTTALVRFRRDTKKRFLDLLEGPRFDPISPKSFSDVLKTAINVCEMNAHNLASECRVPLETLVDWMNGKSLPLPSTLPSYVQVVYQHVASELNRELAHAA